MSTFPLDTTSPPEQDARVMAALAHISVLLPILGIIGAVAIWATQRAKSSFVRFQALQAAIYQFAVMLLGLVYQLCCMPLALIAMAAIVSSPASTQVSADPDTFLPLLFVQPFLIVGLILGGWVLVVIYGLFGALRAFQGHRFRYVLIGRWLARYLTQDLPSQADEEVSL